MSSPKRHEHDSRRQPGKQREVNPNDMAFVDRSRTSGQINYHNLPEITWNAEQFNFDPADFTMQDHASQQDRIAAVPMTTNMQTTMQRVPELPQQDQHARASPPKKVLAPCAHCGKTFSRSYDLHRHESSHSDERRYACEYPGCTKKYKLRQDLKAHERSAHEGRGGGGAVVIGHWRGFEDRLFSM